MGNAHRHRHRYAAQTKTGEQTTVVSCNPAHSAGNNLTCEQTCNTVQDLVTSTQGQKHAVQLRYTIIRFARQGDIQTCRHCQISAQQRWPTWEANLLAESWSSWSWSSGSASAHSAHRASRMGFTSPCFVSCFGLNCPSQCTICMHRSQLLCMTNYTVCFLCEANGSCDQLAYYCSSLTDACRKLGLVFPEVHGGIEAAQQAT